MVEAIDPNRHGGSVNRYLTTCSEP